MFQEGGDPDPDADLMERVGATAGDVASLSASSSGAGSSLLARTAGTARAWGSYLGKTGSFAAWVVGTSVLVLVFPLWLEAEREAELIKFEQEQIQLYASQGYSPTQLQQMQAAGQLGAPPPPPPLQQAVP